MRIRFLTVSFFAKNGLTLETCLASSPDPGLEAVAEAEKWRQRMLQKWKAVSCGAGAASTGDDQRRPPCVALLLPMLIPATLALLLTYIAFVPDLGAGGLYRWRRLHDGVADGAADGAKARTTTLSHIVFGIGASARTWDRRRGYAELWWRPGQMRGHVWLDEEPASPWPETSPPYRVSTEDTSRFGRRAYVSRLSRIVADSFSAVAAEAAAANGTASGDEVRWFVTGDDDTVFFPDNLAAVLRRYDHEEMYYVGAPSESVEQDTAYSYGMAFGGGGFALSYPAAAALARAMDDGCLDRYITLRHSDERVHACLSELGIPLTREPGFHQVDITGDAYGMLAAHPVAPLVSLHHLDHIRPIIPGMTALDAVASLVRASQLDPAQTLQQSFCYDHGPGYNLSVSVSWGYTVQVYPWAVPAVELEVPLQTFKTWRGRPNGPFVFNTRPLSPGGVCAGPVFFFLSRLRNETGGGGATVTEYTRRAVRPGKECDEPGFRAASTVQSVRVFASKMSPSDWERVTCTAAALLSGGEDYDAGVSTGGADKTVC
ncbi:hypothetical protein ACP4OV_002537 [Aristida adscensionis]